MYSNYFPILILILALLFFGSFWGAIWIPTKKKCYERIAKLTDLRPGMTFCDLGSGSGNLLFYLSEKYKINCVGIEISPILYLYSKIKSLFYNKVKIKCGNLFKYDLSNADVIYIFLHPKMYKKLEEKINREVKKNSIIITAYWPFRNTDLLQVGRKNNGIPYYLYKKLPSKN